MSPRYPSPHCVNCPHFPRFRQEEREKLAYSFLQDRVVLVTAGRGREAFTLVRPLMIRLRELAQGEAQVMQISIGGKALTDTSVEALMWYLRNITWTGFMCTKSSKRHGGSFLYMNANWTAFLRLLGVEFSQA